jgi:hypothetical protein
VLGQRTLQLADELRRVWGARERELELYLATFELSHPPGRALDIFLACTVSEVYSLLVHDRGWSVVEYERWLGDSLVSQLLP